MFIRTVGNNNRVDEPSNRVTLVLSNARASTPFGSCNSMAKSYPVLLLLCHHICGVVELEQVDTPNPSFTLWKAQEPTLPECQRPVLHRMRLLGVHGTEERGEGGAIWEAGGGERGDRKGG